MKGHSIGIAQRLRSFSLECNEAFERLTSHEATETGHRDGLQRRETAISFSPARLRQLSEQLGAELASTVVESARLQNQARAKLLMIEEQARFIWVTDKSLQQATPWQIARLKAGWFGGEPVHDLCCGIGGDSLQFAIRGDVVAVERDPLIAAMAEVNLELAGFPPPRAKVICEDVLDIEIPRNSLLHIDPDRRSMDAPESGKKGIKHRTINPLAFQPDWSQVSRMVANSTGALVKLAPASEIPEGGIDPAACHRCWFSLSGTVREQSLLCGSVIERAKRQPQSRSAIIVRNDGSFSEFVPVAWIDSHKSLVPEATVATPQVVVDPNAAIRAAGLTEAFAQSYQLSMMHGPSGFLAAADDSMLAPMEPLATVGRVEWWGKCDDRKLRKVLRERGVYPQTIKVRGADLDPAQLYKRYRACGEQPVTLWIGRDRSGVFAAITASKNT